MAIRLALARQGQFLAGFIPRTNAIPWLFCVCSSQVLEVFADFGIVKVSKLV